MADVIVDVPGGSNNHNYANVTLIVELARLHGVHAVWAGWGHASENPLLPDTLAKSNPPIKFIGPSGPPMRALGDKIGSTIIAQTAGVPCIAWNGDGILAQYDRGTGCLPDGVYEKATIGTAAEAYEAAQRIGFPVMIKASEGGGGKGIRMVSNAEDVANAYRQVCGEIPGSPIFIMKLSSNSRHLEVQLLADEYGNAMALNGRDCSVQRRHQKIIEEGPPIAAPLHVWEQMEKAAVALAKAVGYANAGTVEYLYSESEEKFYFLELNPRLQVEHPVTEMITKANLPACQLQVAMGIKLYNIPDIRRLYGKNRFEDSYGESAVIDFDIAKRIPPYGHCIAVRITAENAEAGFKPTSGGIQELNFRSTPNVWGYFSMDSSGSIHEYADSQFGHLFASGHDREEARRNMVLALKELSIRGDISTTVDYISKLIEFDDFVENNIDTGWLDRLIKANVDGIGSDVGLKKSVSSAKLTSLPNDVKAVIGALIVAFDSCTIDEEQFRNSLAKGQLPSQSLLLMEREVELILDGTKYRLCCRRNNPNRFSVSVSGCPEKVVVASIRRLSDGGYLTDIGGKSRVAYLTSRGDAASGMRITIGGVSVSFSPDYDPSSLRTDVAGKLVKKLAEDGAHLKKGEAYCEIEVMKMFMPLKVTEAGTITWKNNEGATLSPGDLIATLELDSPENIAMTTVFEGDLDVEGWCSDLRTTSSKRPHLMLRNAFASLNNGMSGYIVSEEVLNTAFEDLKMAVSNPLLPVYEIEEPLSVLSGRLEARLYENLCKDVSHFKDSHESHTK
jgi:Biotin carboxylase